MANSSSRSTTRADEKSVLREVRELLSRERELPHRYRRLERMERAAVVWMNGRALGGRPSASHLYETYD